MSTAEGQGALYDALKTLQAHWDRAQDVWQDQTRAEFTEQTWEPLEDHAKATLQAIERLALVFGQLKGDCGTDEGW